MSKEAQESYNQPAYDALSLGKLMLDDKDLMKQLNLSRSTLQRLRYSGTLPYSKVGRKILYRRMDVIAMLEKARIAAQEGDEKGEGSE